MKKLNLFLHFSLILIILNCKSKYEKNDKNCCIEWIGYWEQKNNIETKIPFSLLKIDTINHIGYEILYSQYGKEIQKTIIIDKENAIKFYYDEDTISACYFGKYKLINLAPKHPDVYYIKFYKTKVLIKGIK